MAIEDRLAGSYSPSPGVIYPTLTLLEEIGHATVEESDGKKLYAITEEGRGYLAAQQPAVDAALARMAAGNEGHGGRAPQIVRAMENLKTALRLRQRQGRLSEDELQRIAEILDCRFAVAYTKTGSTAQRLSRDAREELYISLLGKSQTFHDRQRVGPALPGSRHEHGRKERGQGIHGHVGPEA